MSERSSFTGRRFGQWIQRRPWPRPFRCSRCHKFVWSRGYLPDHWSGARFDDGSQTNHCPECTQWFIDDGERFLADRNENLS